MPSPLLLKEYQIEHILISIYEPDRSEIIQQYQSGLILFPYWSQVWPAAIALSRFLIQHPHCTKNKRVLELSAGLGLPSVTAARNAASVIASDYVEDALTAMQQTVKYNCLQNMQVQLLDWYTLPANVTTDVLLLSDTSYDVTLFTLQENVIRRFLEQDSTIIISTPQRLMAKEAIKPLLSFCRQQEEVIVSLNQAEVPITIIVLQKS